MDQPDANDGRDFAMYATNHLRVVQHPHLSHLRVDHGKGLAFLLHVFQSFLEHNFGEERLGGLAAAFYGEFAKYNRAPRHDPYLGANAVRQLILKFEPFLKKIAYCRFAGQNVWHGSLDALAAALLDISPEETKAINRRSDSVSRWPDVHKVVYAELMPWRHKEAHEARSAPDLMAVEKQATQVLGLYLLALAKEENLLAVVGAIDAEHAREFASLENAQLGAALREACDTHERRLAGLKYLFSLRGVAPTRTSGLQVDARRTPLNEATTAAVRAIDEIESARSSQDWRRGEWITALAGIVAANGTLTQEIARFGAGFLESDIDADGVLELIMAVSAPTAEGLPGDEAADYGGRSDGWVLLLDWDGAVYSRVAQVDGDEHVEHIQLGDVRGDGTTQLICKWLRTPHTSTVQVFDPKALARPSLVLDDVFTGDWGAFPETDGDVRGVVTFTSTHDAVHHTFGQRYAWNSDSEAWAVVEHWGSYRFGPPETLPSSPHEAVVRFCEAVGLGLLEEAYSYISPELAAHVTKEDLARRYENATPVFLAYGDEVLVERDAGTEALVVVSSTIEAFKGAYLVRASGQTARIAELPTSTASAALRHP